MEIIKNGNPKNECTKGNKAEQRKFKKKNGNSIVESF